MNPELWAARWKRDWAFVYTATVQKQFSRIINILGLAFVLMVLFCWVVQVWLAGKAI